LLIELDRYRPGNLLIGGGGRGVRVAPKEHGTGEWVVIRDEGNLIGEVLMKRSAWLSMQKTEHLSSVNPDGADQEKQEV